MSGPTEFQSIAALRSILDTQTGGRARFELENGDDAAVLTPRRGRFVWSIDDSVEGHHFRLDWLTARQVARRAVHAAASDLAAMGASPVGALVSLQLPPSFGLAKIRQLGLGQLDASNELGLPIIGGNLTAGPTLRLTTTVLGTCVRPWRRDRAKAGDLVWLFGELGGAACGLRILQERLAPPRGLGAAFRKCLKAFRQPRAKVAEATGIAELKIGAAIDISDGLGADLGHVARASKVRIDLESETVLAALAGGAERVVTSWRRAPLDIALAGGEDYGLCVFTRRDLSAYGARAIGLVGTPRKRAGGVFVDGAPVAAGFQHR